MQKELIELAPLIKHAAEETTTALEYVGKEKIEADKVRVVVEADEAVATTKKNAADKIQRQCDVELEAALPEQRKAIAALDVIKQAEIKELAGYGSVTDCIVDVCWGWVIITNAKIIKERDPNTLKNVV